MTCNLKGQCQAKSHGTAQRRALLSSDDLWAYLERKIVAQHSLQVIRFLCLHRVNWAQAAGLRGRVPWRRAMAAMRPSCQTRLPLAAPCRDADTHRRLLESDKSGRRAWSQGVHKLQGVSGRDLTCFVLLPNLILALPVSRLLLRWLCSVHLMASRPLSPLALASADRMPESLHRTSLVMHAHSCHLMLRQQHGARTAGDLKDFYCLTTGSEGTQRRLTGPLRQKHCDALASQCCPEQIPAWMNLNCCSVHGAGAGAGACVCRHDKGLPLYRCADWA